MQSNRSFWAATFVAALAATFVFGGCVSGTDTLTLAERGESDRPSFSETRAIAEEGFIYGLPIVMNYAVMYEFCVDKNSGQYKGPFNQIANEARVFTYQDTSVITPNSDTPYSMLWLDLRAEPMVISVPAVEKQRYYSVMLCDGNTFNYGYIGSRATGNDAGDYLVVGPGWTGSAPPGIKRVFHATTQFALTIFRTQLFNAEDMSNVVKVQSGYRVQSLSSYLHQPAPPPAAVLDFPKVNQELVKTNFFEYLDFALQFAPPGPEEREIRAKLARIGIGPGKPFDFKDLSLEHKAEIALGMKQGEKKIEEKVAAIGKSINGWHVGAAFGDRAFFNGDWLLRAAAAKAGIYGNDAEEAMYPMTRWLANGETLDGSKHNYTLTFEAGKFPPVNAFWSVTMYDGKTQLLIKNPINRYLINSPMLPQMKKNADSSLTIYVQRDSPGKDLESNWLPAPDGPVYLVMRLYWPKTEPPSILPPGAGTWAPPPLQIAK
ncbi:MAG: cell envelope protein [Planctomycetota bacterium]|nr:MAG: cell envelope protein [Planctomycetota bacterium]